MPRRISRTTVFLWLSIGVAGVFTACGGDPTVAGNNESNGFGGSAGSSSGAAAGAAGMSGSAGTSSGAGSFGGSFNVDGGPPDGSTLGFDVQPEAPQTLTVDIGSTTPTTSFNALLDGQPIAAGWSVDRGEIASVTLGAAETGVVTPTGLVGGTVKVSAGLNDQIVEREVLVQLRGEQNGADPTNPSQVPQIAGAVSELTEGGGIGGVGGDGLGVALTDQGLIDALNAPALDGSAEGLRLVYPYDTTVFPRGILAPVLAWDWTLADADAIKIELDTQSGSFSWSGTFGRPAILAQTGTAFVQHPIPQNVWEAATNSASGSTNQLQLKVTIARAGQAYGPLTQSWTVAPARLSGTIYYNSYGTNLAKNFDGAVGGDTRFGGAVLSIRVGDTGPQLVAGGNGDSSYCRVCHSVAADGSRLVTQHGDASATSSAYDLLVGGGATETPMTVGAEYPGIYPDGSMALSPAGQLLPLPGAAAPLAAMGLDTVSTSLGTPMFSPNGERVVFNPMTGPGVTNPTQKLVVMNFDLATLTFSNPVEVADYSGEAVEVRPGWGAFFPDNQSLVFHKQSAAGSDLNGHGAMRTRKGARAQIHWTSTNGSGDVTPLNALNGLDPSGSSYLPALLAAINMSCTGDGVAVGAIDTRHEDDANLNYEPTVNPVASGGYAWVVFASRRRYANVATIPPFCSDPRGVDLIQNITPKKLWVAAVDLNATPGTDPSHPAFYLPGQELLAGNSRGFWVLDPCRPDGESCATGDQCCNGFCQPNASTGVLECSNVPPNGMCSQIQEKCDVDADCCDATAKCLNGFCAQDGPK